MLTFEEWYENSYPDIFIDSDDFYAQLKKCYEDAWNDCNDYHRDLRDQ